MSPHWMRFLTWAAISPRAAWNLCAPAAFCLRIQQHRSFNVAGCQAVRSRGSRTEPPGEESACASRPVDTHQGRKRKNLGGSCGTDRPRRGGAGAVAGAGGLWGSLSQSNGAEHRAQSGDRPEKQTTLHVTSPLNHISPCHPTHPTTLIFDLLSVQFPSNLRGSLPPQCIM